MNKIYLKSIALMAAVMATDAQAMMARLGQAAGKAISRTQAYQTGIRKLGTMAESSVQSAAKGNVPTPPWAKPDWNLIKDNPYMRNKLTAEYFNKIGKPPIEPKITPPAPKSMTPPAPTPAPVAESVANRAGAAAKSAQPSMWQRMQTYMGRTNTPVQPVPSSVSPNTTMMGRFKSLSPTAKKAVVGTVAAGAALHQRSVGLASIIEPQMSQPGLGKYKVQRSPETVLRMFQINNDMRNRQIALIKDDLAQADNNISALGREYRELIEEISHQFDKEYAKINQLDQEDIRDVQSLGERDPAEYQKRHKKRVAEIRQLSARVKDKQRAVENNDPRILDNKKKRENLYQVKEQMIEDKKRLEQLQALSKRLERDKALANNNEIIDGLAVYNETEKLTPRLEQELTTHQRTMQAKKAAVLTAPIKGLFEDEEVYAKRIGKGGPIVLPKEPNESDKAYKARLEERIDFAKKRLPRMNDEPHDLYNERIKYAVERGFGRE